MADDEECTFLDRRTVLNGIAGAGPLVALARMAEAQEGDDATQVPEEARSVEAGLELFVAKWEAGGPAITTGRFGRYLQGNVYNIYLAQGGHEGSDTDPRAYRLELGPDAGASLTPGPDPAAHVELTVDEDDLVAILYGEYSGVAAGMAGRTFAPKSQVNEASLLAIVFYILAHVPLSLVHELDANAEALQGIASRGGSSSCGTDIAHSESPETVLRERNEDRLTGAANRAPDVITPLSNWTHRLSYEDLPPAVVDAVKSQLKSLLGVSFAATTMEPGRRFLDGVASLERGGPSTVVAGQETFRTSPENAALANAALAQLLEWEDVTYMSHAGSAVVPTALAVAEAADGVTGEDLIAAVVVGNEIAGRAGIFLHDPTNLGQSLPVHQTELPFVAGKLYGLSPEELQDASGIAGTQPQMTAIRTWTADSKGLIGGEPAASSIRAARFAKAGMHGARDHLSNVSGYWYRVSDIWDPRELALVHEGLDPEEPSNSNFRLKPPGVGDGEYFDKRFPCDHFKQTAVHAALQLREEVAVADIEEVNVRMNTAMAATGTLFNAGEFAYLPEKILDDGEPGWTYTALLYDGVYPVVAGLVAGELTHRQYQVDWIEANIEEIERLYRATSLLTDVSLSRFGAEVNITTADGLGQQVTGSVDAATGSTSHEATVNCFRDMTEIPVDGEWRSFDADTKLQVAAEPVIGDRWRAIRDAVDGLDQRSGALEELLGAIRGSGAGAGVPGARGRGR